MNKIFAIVFLLFLSNCSFDTKSGIWTQEKKIKETKKNVIELFEKKKNFNK